jgi:Na+-driven multidrug efflux pump
VPLAWLLANWMGPAGIFAAAALANILSGIAAWLWFRRTCRGYTAAGKAAGPAT